MAKRTDKKRKYICEELEPRILLSAGVEGLVYDSAWEPDATLEAETDAAQIVALFNSNQTSSSEPTSEIVFIDSSLPDYQSLIADLVDNNDTNRQFEIILLNEQDGISQITDYLQSQDDIDAIHFITHGEDGAIQLGNDLIDIENIESYSSEFLLWKSALDENADILFYGCDVASTNEGLSLIQTISDLTEADVAASDDTTGNTQLGGDWELEKNVGSIETSIAFSSETQNNWVGILPVISFQDGVNGYTGTVDTGIDSLAPNDSSEGTEESVSVDGGMSDKEGLIRFDNIFGSGANQIAYGSTINSATLTFNVTDGTTGGATVALNVMLVSWDENSTWNSLSGGVSLDDVEASSTADSVLGSPNITGSKTFTGLETTLQSWSDGGTNYGWVITNSSTNNWDFNQSDETVIASRPILTVDYTTNVDPVITSSATASSAENTPATTTILTVTATDADGDTPTYSITGGTADDALFSIDTNTGALTFNISPDFETPGDIGGNNVYNIQVTADDGNGGLTTQNVAITVTNVNEAPVIDSVTGTFTAAENSTTVVATAAASDVDAGDTLTYSLAGVDSGFFTINGSGAITFTAPDFDTAQDNNGDNTFDTQVIVTDALGLQSTQNISVSLTNANEAPVIDSVTGTFTAAENSTTVVATAAASDVDAGDTLTYSLAGVDSGFFTINGSGAITFTAPDFDTAQDNNGDNVFEIQVIVTDALGLQSTQNISVSLTNANEAPVIDSVTGTFTAAENTTTVVATAAASDVDAGDTLTYSLAGVDSGFFTINGSGAITFTAPDFDTAQDNNGDNVFEIQVIVTDALGLQSTQNISVSLTNANEAPVIDSVTGTFTAAENSTTVVATAAASDVDAGDTLTYSLGGVDAGFFTINGSGAITFTAPDFDIAQDTNGDNVFEIQVIVTDASGAQDTQNISVSLTNTNEAPTIDSVTGTFTAAENTTTVVASAAASDVDAGDTLTYSLGGVDSGFFTINGSGAITFTAPDFDTAQDTNGDNIFEIQVIVTDALGLQTTQNISVSLTNANEAPVIDSVTGTFTAAENSTTVVATAAASDVDAGDTLTYSLGGVDAGFFTINGSGAITFTAPDFDTAQDTNGDNVFEIQVIVTDSLGLQTTQNISVLLTNANEAPVIDSVTGTFTAAENSTTVVASAAASDVDAGDTLTYSLGGVDAGFFTINGSGAITFTAPDFDIAQDNNGDNVFEIQVIVADALGLQSTQNISVSLTNANEAPVIDSVTGTFTAAENSTTVVATAAASDVDAGDTLTYSLGGVDAGFFSINGSGAITFTAPDFDTAQDTNGDNVFEIQVIVTDSLGLQTTQNISVSLTNTNEAPVLNPIGNPSVLENSTGIITTAIATDADAGDTLTYTLSGVDAALFSIDSVTGAISFTAPDFENPLDNGGNNVYDIQVIATDLMGLTATQNIMVTVVDVNEAPTSTDQQFSINGSSVNGSLVGDVIASDLDTGDTLAYTVTGGTGLGSFSIDSGSGQITVINSSALESNVAQVYTLAVLVTDSSGNTSTSTVTISVSPSIITNPVIITPPPVETNTSPVRVDTASETTLEHSGYSFHSHIILNPADSTHNGQSSNNNGIENDADTRDIKVDWLSSSKNVFGSEYLSYRSGGAFYDALDKMNHDIDESAETRANSIFSAGIRGTGIALTAGVASWVLRGSSLLASFLSTVPVWRGLDPLPILAAARKKQTKDVNIAKSKKNNSDTDTDDVDDIFEENNNAPKNPTQDA